MANGYQPTVREAAKQRLGRLKKPTTPTTAGDLDIETHAPADEPLHALARSVFRAKQAIGKGPDPEQSKATLGERISEEKAIGFRRGYTKKQLEVE